MQKRLQEGKKLQRHRNNEYADENANLGNLDKLFQPAENGVGEVTSQDKGSTYTRREWSWKIVEFVFYKTQMME